MRKNPIVCFAGDNYWFSNPHSRYHLMNALHRRGHAVLWVNSIGMNMPKVRRSGFATRVLLKLRSWSRWLGEARAGFHVLTPIALPLFGNRTLTQMNDRWIGLQVNLACKRLGIRKPLVFASIPSFAGVVGAMDRSGLLYYYSDKYESYRDISARESIAAMDRQLFEAADGVFCASEKVYDSLKALRSGVHLLPHAVDFEHFNSALSSDEPEPEDLRRIPHPRIGYFGSITSSNDQEMIHHAAANAPDLQFVLIGRVLGDYSRLERLANVHFLGFKEYELLPSYGKHFDVAFMCWIMTDWIRHSNPLKTKEYLSLGLPVVSVRIEHLEREFSELVLFAETGEEFLAQIRAALEMNGTGDRKRRIDAVRGESWDARAGEMMATWTRTTAAGTHE